jgi:glycosyltransferase involved in cell wall biosynthesis
MTGYYKDADSLLAAANVACLSSKNEALGSVLLDAFLLGKPIAATRAGGIPEVVEHGVCGLLVEPGDADGLGTVIASLFTDRALSARLGEAARQRAARFSVERLTEDTLKIYRNVLAGRFASETSSPV